MPLLLFTQEWVFFFGGGGGIFCCVLLIYLFVDFYSKEIYVYKYVVVIINLGTFRK